MIRPQLPALGMGTAAIGNLYVPVSDAAAADAVEAALGAGIRYFDTAPHYGFGLAERRLGEALAGIPATLSTKVGRLLEPTIERGIRHGFAGADPFEPRFDYSADGIRRSYDSSLRRLRRDRVEILLAHDLGADTHGAAHPHHLRTFLDEGYPAMRRLKDAGTTDAVGIGVNEIAICLDLLQRVELDVILLAGRYSLLDRSAAERLIPECARRGVTLVIGGPYNSGILAQDDLSGTAMLHYDYQAASPALVARVRRLAQMCGNFGVTLPTAAIQFPVRNPAVSTVIAGLADRREVASTIARMHASVPEELWRRLEAAADVETSL